MSIPKLRFKKNIIGGERENIMSIFNSSAVVKALIAGGTIGGLVFGTLTFTGSEDLSTIKEKFDYVMENYQNALVNIGNYKTVLNNKNEDLKSYENIQDELLAEIAELEAQVKNLEENGNESDEATIAELNTQIQDLQAQIAQMEEEAMSEEDYNSLIGEIERLQNELTNANNEVAELEDYITNQANISPTAIVSVEDIESSDEIRNPLLTYELVGAVDSLNDTKRTVTLNALNNLGIFDTFKESPLLCHVIEWNNSIYVKLNVNSPEAFERISAYENARISSDTMVELFVDNLGNLTTQENKAYTISITLVSDDYWTGTLGYATPDHN